MLSTCSKKSNANVGVASTRATPRCRPTSIESMNQWRLRMHRQIPVKMLEAAKVDAGVVEFVDEVATPDLFECLKICNCKQTKNKQTSSRQLRLVRRHCHQTNPKLRFKDYWKEFKKTTTNGSLFFIITIIVNEIAVVFIAVVIVLRISRYFF